MSEIVDLLKSEIEYFKKLKTAIGDLHGHIHSLAVKTAKVYLSEKYPNITDWEMSEKYGSGIDIVGRNRKGEVLVAAEIKTTFRAKKENLGSQQRTKIKEDIAKLLSSNVKSKYFFVIDNKNKKAIQSILNNYKNNNIQLLNIFGT